MTRIIGHGIDLTPVARIARLLADHPARFRERCFTPGEQARAAGHAREAEHLAARFAAKEATLKALGRGWTDGIAWTDVEVVTLASGAPTLRLSGRAAEIAADLGVRDWYVSLTHTDGLAMASVVAWGG